MAANAISGPHGRDVTEAEAASTAPVRNRPLDELTFSDVLDAINPLQYVPVVGTIYRVVTGDRGNSGLRTALSMLTGALTAGPVGIMTSIAGNLIENFLHVEESAHAALAGTGSAAKPAVSPPAAPPAKSAAVATEAAPAHVARAATAAYAVAAGFGSRLDWGGRER